MERSLVKRRFIVVYSANRLVLRLSHRTLRRVDIVRPLLIESVLISVGGGLRGIAFGFGFSPSIARFAECKTIVPSASVVIAFGVSIAVGLVFGIYPAMKAARINPGEALHYE